MKDTKECYECGADLDKSNFTLCSFCLSEKHPLEPQIPLSEAFEFAEWVKCNFYEEKFDSWERKNISELKRYTDSELYQLFLESKLKSNDQEKSI